MSLYDTQMQAKMNQFQSAVTSLAWGLAGQVIEQQRKKLASGLVDIDIQSKKKSSSPELSKNMTKYAALVSRTGTWTRGGGVYMTIGPGALGTYRLKDINTSKEITAVIKTLITRWKHTP